MTGTPGELSGCDLERDRRVDGGLHRTRPVAVADLCAREPGRLHLDGLTKGERRLVLDGKEDAVLQMRHTYQGTMRTELIAVVEQLTGRKVAAFMSDNHVNPDVAVETFVLELLDGEPIVSKDDADGRAPA